MEIFEIEDLTFTYPGKESPAIRNINIKISKGEFVLICGESGSGKSTLLRNMKPALAPNGEKSGRILFGGCSIEEIDPCVQAAKIGYVLQDPYAQTVTDKVWHELAFGLENLGEDTKKIRLRTAETASFFGIQQWFDKDVDQLSGGQRQLMNLAAVMTLQPEVIILDEPTGQLDAIAAEDFIGVLKKINRELGTTVIMTEHRLEEAMAVSDRVIVMDEGRIISDDMPAATGMILERMKHPMFDAMPAPVRCYAEVCGDNKRKRYIRCKETVSTCPVDVREGRTWLEGMFENRKPHTTSLPEKERNPQGKKVVEVKDVWFRYDRYSEDVLKGLSLEVNEGELYCMVGGNGAGKTTALSVISGIKSPYRGTVKIKGKKLSDHRKKEIFNGLMGVLPQNPKSIFVENSVKKDLLEALAADESTAEEKEKKIRKAAEITEIEKLLDCHPYDISGGEQQKAALAKVLLKDPEILILDEPTKGFDGRYKKRFAEILKRLTDMGKTVIMVSHDIEFCSRYGDRCAMFFNGNIIVSDAPRRFFSGNSFYTTSANRMSRNVFENAVTSEDVIKLIEINEDEADFDIDDVENDPKPFEEEQSGFLEDNIKNNEKVDAVNEIRRGDEANVRSENRKIKTLLCDILLMAAAAATLVAGYLLIGNQRYMIVCVMLILYSMAFFAVNFERRKPKAREIVLLAVLTTAAVAARAAFFMVPNFKPMLAIVIIAAAALGKEAGFMTGALSAFVSNMFFGQGPWTPWQMAGMALAGYIAGALFHRCADKLGESRLLKWALVIFGGAAAFFLYGAVVDMWTILMMTEKPSLETALVVYTAAVPFNIVHAAATMIFILLLAVPVTEKIARARKKYGEV